MKCTGITTVFPENRRTEVRQECVFAADEGVEKQVINLYPEETFQVFEGFGGAFTDSAGFVYAQMKAEDREKMLSVYFDEGQMNYRLGRMHLDSCDFSVEQYEALSDEKDREMKGFSLERTKKYIFPLLRDAEKRAGRPIELMVSPWSPPAFMKANGERSNGGKLREDCRDFWADYICMYIKRLREEGLHIGRMSIQNEPKAVQTWDSCVYTAEEERDFLKDHLYPALVKNGLEDVEVFIWDHNKERLYERACTIITEETDHMVMGLAFHWYSGDHFEALELVKRRFPDKKLILSEACIEYSIYDSEDYLTNAQKYAHDIIGNLNAGMNAFYDWNLILDEKGGPNHVQNLCDAPYLYDMEKKELMERNTLAYIWHFSHFIMPGAVRIGFTRYASAIDMTAFRNPDGKVVCVILNAQEKELWAYLRIGQETVRISVLPKSITTFMMEV